MCAPTEQARDVLIPVGGSAEESSFAQLGWQSQVGRPGGKKAALG